MPIGRIGKYERLDLLGHGASGVVHLAWDTLLRRRVALKEIRVAGPEIERVLSEARLLDRLQHPRIVAVHSVDQVDGAILIDMEWVDGRNLADILRERDGAPLPLPQALHVATALLDALAYAHERRILHRDIKPGNLLIGTDGTTVKLTDFGLAEALGSRSVAEGGGTFPYMAPEDFAEGAASDVRSDLWAVGVVVYEMLTGRRPFTAHGAKDPFSWKRAVETEIPPAPSTVVAGLPPAIDHFLERALAKDKAARFPEARSMSEAMLAAAGVAPAPLAPAHPDRPPLPVPDPEPDDTEFVFEDGMVATTLDGLLAGAARNWDMSRRALLDGRFAAFLDTIGEIWIAELARELASRRGASPDKLLREFLERSQADPDAGEQYETVEPDSATRTMRAPRDEPEPVAAAETSPETPPKQVTAQPVDDGFRWWYLPVFAIALAPVVAAALNTAGLSGIERILGRLFAAAALSGLHCTMLLVTGVALRVPIWARALCIPPAVVGVFAAGVWAAQTTSGPSGAGKTGWVAGWALAAAGTFVIQAVTYRRAWRFWLGATLVGSLVAAVWSSGRLG